MKELLKKIRNFSIIAHIDHGKSTLTDRFIQLTYRNKEVYEKDRLTDVLEIEQERGITIKLQPVQLPWKGYTLNLIDTPGHVDFSYEVSRSLRACEGAILLIDATQGIQAQTISTMLMAIEHDLEIIPVLNKIDIASEELIKQRLDEIQAILGFHKNQIILASGKTGAGAVEILDAVVERIPNASENTLLKELNIKDFNKNLAALIFDSFYDIHKGVVAFVRVFSGYIKPGDIVYLANMKEAFLVKEVGIFTPHLNKTSELVAGNVGYIATGIKDIKKVRIGDTITTKQDIITIPGFEKPKSKVFASMYPVYKEDFLQLKEALEKLTLNDASLSVKSDYSSILGQGFKMGFLGLLHLDITKERLSREFGVETVVTMPSVEYKVELKTGEILRLKGADAFPDPHSIKGISEPVVLGEIIVPNEYLNNIYELLRQTRAKAVETYNLYSSTIHNTIYIGIKITLPYAELIKGFFNKLKAVSKGYASLQYDKVIYESVDLVKVDILVNKQIIPSLSFLEVPEKARDRARRILLILKDNLERQMFPVPLQAAVGGKIIARETIPAYRKNVTAKLYGGDITRKMKLWHNQAQKKRLRSQHIKVNVPHKAFVKIMQDT